MSVKQNRLQNKYNRQLHELMRSVISFSTFTGCRLAVTVNKLILYQLRKCITVTHTHAELNC